MEAGLDLDTRWFISLDRVRCLEDGDRGSGLARSRMIQDCSDQEKDVVAVELLRARGGSGLLRAR